MPKTAGKAPKTFYMGQKVKVKVDGQVRSGEVIDWSGAEICVRWPEGGTKWVNKSAVIG